MLISWTRKVFKIWKKSLHFCIFLLFLYLCNRNSLAGLVHIQEYMFYSMWEKLISWTSIHFRIFLLFLHLCSKKSYFFQMEFFYYYSLFLPICIFLLFLNLWNGNSFARKCRNSLNLWNRNSWVIYFSKLLFLPFWIFLLLLEYSWSYTVTR